MWKWKPLKYEISLISCCGYVPYKKKPTCFNTVSQLGTSEPACCIQVLKPCILTDVYWYYMTVCGQLDEFMDG